MTRGSFCTCSMSPSASTRPSCSTVTRRAIERTKSISCSTTTTECCPRATAGVVRYVQSPGESYQQRVHRAATVRGSCIRSMPISSHCFWPWDNILSRHPALIRETDDSQNFFDSLVLRDRHPGQQCLERMTCGPPEPARDSRRRSAARKPSALKFSSDAGLRDFRFGELEQIDSAAEPRFPRIRPCFARDDIHHRCLAGAVGADDATQLSGFDVAASTRSAP